MSALSVDVTYLSVGHVTASTFDKGGHAFIVVEAILKTVPKSSDKCLLSKGYKRKNAEQRRESFAD